MADSNASTQINLCRHLKVDLSKAPIYKLKKRSLVTPIQSIDSNYLEILLVFFKVFIVISTPTFMILWNNVLVREKTWFWQKPSECQLRISSCWTHSRKWSLNCPLIKCNLPFAQIIGVIDKIILEAYFSRYL